jgi:hypothetical protein
MAKVAGLEPMTAAHHAPVHRETADSDMVLVEL